MNDNSGKKAGNRINEDEMCMICGRRKEERNLVCYSCYKQWQGEQIASVANKTKFVSISEWTLKMAETLTSSINVDLAQAQKELDEFKEKTSQQAYEDVKESLNGKAVERGLFSEMLQARQQKLWEEGDGNKFYGRLKSLERRAEKLPGFTQGLKEKVAAKAKEAKETQETE